MKWIDFLFYSYYCYFERRSKRHPDLFGRESRTLAIGLLALTFGPPIGICYGIVDSYIVSLPPIPKMHSLGDNLIGIIIGTILISPFIYRYFYDKRITAGRFKIFREEWGNDPRMHTTKRIIVIIYTFTTLLLPLWVALVMHFIVKGHS